MLGSEIASIMFQLTLLLGFLHSKYLHDWISASSTSGNVSFFPILFAAYCRQNEPETLGGEDNPEIQKLIPL